MIGLVVGAGFGLGIALAASSFGASVGLGELLADDHGDRNDDLLARERRWPGRRWFARAVEAPAANDLFTGTRFGSDLTVCERARVDFVATIAGKAAIVSVLTIVVARQSPIGGGIRALLLAVGAALIVALVDVRRVQEEAELRRTDMLRALTAYIEFARLAAHTQSIEGAMRASARMGATWPFRVIERVFEQARRRGAPPWSGLAELGARYDMREVTELAGALEVAAAEGTHVQEMLSAKASSMRRRMTEVEVAEADSATQKLAVPIAVIALTIVGLLLAPAVLAF